MSDQRVFGRIDTSHLRLRQADGFRDETILGYPHFHHGDGGGNAVRHDNGTMQRVPPDGVDDDGLLIRDRLVELATVEDGTLDVESGTPVDIALECTGGSTVAN